MEPETPPLASAKAVGGTQKTVHVTLDPANRVPTADQLLWILIRNRTKAIGFDNYKAFIDKVMCAGRMPDARQLVPGTVGYQLLKTATESFLMHEIGVLDVERIFAGWKKDPSSFDALDETSRLGFQPTMTDLEKFREAYYQDLGTHHHVLLPYLARIIENLKDVPLKGPDEVPPNCYGIQVAKVVGPLALELIWSYWHEEGMLVQAANAISMRFQNRRGPGERDPLANLEIDPLRPLNNLLWGYIQDELHRLTVVRRAYEYDHHYGLRLVGKAVPEMRTADSRGKFLEAFHRLQYLCAQFFKQADDTTVIADGFPVLNGLKEVHLLLSEGAHNQYGDLPWTARAEMLMQQWLLARPEMRQFLPSRTMVAYPEPWMGPVDAMKRLQSWNDTPVLHFRNLAVFGEQLLLSIRFGNWASEVDATRAANWARYWRYELQGYSYAYNVVTNVDVTLDHADTTLPSELLSRRSNGAR